MLLDEPVKPSQKEESPFSNAQCLSVKNLKLLKNRRCTIIEERSSFTLDLRMDQIQRIDEEEEKCHKKLSSDSVGDHWNEMEKRIMAFLKCQRVEITSLEDLEHQQIMNNRRKLSIM